MINKKDIWLKRSNKNSNITQISVFNEVSKEWDVYFCPIKELYNFMNKSFEMAKFKHINNISNNKV